MTDEREQSTPAGADEPSPDLEQPSKAGEPAAVSPRPPSDTVGTGSYIAVTCSVAVAIAIAIGLGILFLARWLS